jgi:hypothetical protein
MCNVPVNPKVAEYYFPIQFLINLPIGFNHAAYCNFPG